MKKDSSLDELKKKIEHLKASQHTPFAEDKPTSSMGKYLNVGVELIAGILVGIGVGFIMDGWLGTRPLFLIIFFLFGSGAGMLNVYRALVRQDEKNKNDTQDKKQDEDNG